MFKFDRILKENRKDRRMRKIWTTLIIVGNNVGL